MDRGAAHRRELRPRAADIGAGHVDRRVGQEPHQLPRLLVLRHFGQVGDAKAEVGVRGLVDGVIGPPSKPWPRHLRDAVALPFRLESEQRE